jgi:hypothetical protein
MPSPRIFPSVLPDNERREERFTGEGGGSETSAPAVSFEQYGGNAAENY